MLVCPETCLDKPFDQLRSPILPPDPIPRINPRPSPNTTGLPYIGNPLPTPPQQQGFTVYSFGSKGNFTYPLTRADVLAAVAQASGVPTPEALDLASYTVPMTGVPVVLVPSDLLAGSTPLVPANPQRGYLLIYNPTQFGAVISTGLATSGARGNLAIGPGQAYFWSSKQGLAPVYQGQLTALGAYPPLPLWAWEDQVNLTLQPANLLNDMGVLYLTANVADYPTSPTGLTPGAVWSNGLAVTIVPNGIPNPSLPTQVFFGSVTASALLAVGGANLPTTDPKVANQLWNNGGLCCVSFGGGTVTPSLNFSQSANTQFVPVVL